MKPELISFKICPFVQRSVIVLKEKGVDFDITYINLKEPPSWFQEISPLGKVPLLRVDEAIVFESAVIMEYLDEVYPPSLHPADPLRKAHNRAWIEFASSLLECQREMVMAKDKEACDQAELTLRERLARVNEQVRGPLFNGEDFSLIDAAYAPLFMRLALLEQWQPMGLLDGMPKLQAWSEQLLARPAVKESVVAELPQLYRAFIASSAGYGATCFAAQ